MHNLVEEIKKGEDVYYGEGASEDQISKAEEELGVTFADEYKDYLRAFGCVDYYGIEFTGITDDPDCDVVESTRALREQDPGTDRLYLVLDTLYEDIHFWQSASGEIYRVEPGTKPYKVHDSFYDFLVSIKEALEEIDDEDDDDES